MACDTQELISANPCFYDLNPRRLRQVQAAMLCQWKNKLESGDSVTCDPQELIDDSVCFNELNPHLLEVLITSLMCQISELLP